MIQLKFLAHIKNQSMKDSVNLLMDTVETIIDVFHITGSWESVLYKKLTGNMLKICT